VIQKRQAFGALKQNYVNSIYVIFLWCFHPCHKIAWIDAMLSIFFHCEQGCPGQQRATRHLGEEKDAPQQWHAALGCVGNRKAVLNHGLFVGGYFHFHMGCYAVITELYCKCVGYSIR
jgi:hypothetical protein